MTINELHIQLDLQPENRIGILENIVTKCSNGYFFVDSNNGHCYLFDENGNEDDVKKLTKLDTELFYDDSNIESIIIPNSIRSIEYLAFYNCKNLKSVIIPNSVKSIGDYAFYSCESLKSIKIPDSVESIGYGAFHCCESLKSIEIPNLVKSIGKLAFAYCEGLKSMTFKRKTMMQVKAMKNYPFGIEDESIIRCI